MRKLFILFVLFSLIISLNGNAQRWKKVRYEFIYGIGATNFWGDLGGGKNLGKTWFSDYDIQGTRLAVFGAMRYRMTQRFSTKLNLIFGSIRGSDEYAGTINKKTRNLSFKSIIAESSVQMELSITKEKTGRRYSFTSGGKIRLDGVNSYLFTGIGGVYFNPKGLYGVNGKWYTLQPLGTEGQGLPGGKAKYSRIAACFPVGFGVKYGYNRKINFGIEFGYRFTTTDYMDDVHDSYYDNQAILDARGEVAAYFADPREGQRAGPGSRYRGGPKYKDSYMFILFNFSMKLRVGRSGMPKF